MNTLNKVAVMAFAAAVTTTVTASAEDRVVRVDHGRTQTYVVRDAERDRTIAVYADGRAVGHTGARQSSDSNDRDIVIHLGRGQTVRSSAPQ